jgi:hypothetical protein
MQNCALARFSVWPLSQSSLGHGRLSLSRRIEHWARTVLYRYANLFSYYIKVEETAYVIALID